MPKITTAYELNTIYKNMIELEKAFFNAKTTEDMKKARLEFKTILYSHPFYANSDDLGESFKCLLYAYASRTFKAMVNMENEKRKENNQPLIP